MQTVQFQCLKLIYFKSTLKEHLIGFQVVIMKDKCKFTSLFIVREPVQQVWVK